MSQTGNYKGSPEWQAMVNRMKSVNEILPSDYLATWWFVAMKDTKFAIILSDGRRFNSCFNYETNQWVITEKNSKFIVTHWEVPKVSA